MLFQSIPYWLFTACPECLKEDWIRARPHQAVKNIRRDLGELIAQAEYICVVGGSHDLVGRDQNAVYRELATFKMSVRPLFKYKVGRGDTQRQGYSL